MIQDLKEYLKNKLKKNNITTEDKELFKESMKWYKMDDKWFMETFEDYCIENNITDNLETVEKDYYDKRFSESFIDIPDYNFYQNMLYERLEESLLVDDKIFIKLVKLIKGISHTEIVNYKKYSIKLFYTDDFNKDSDEFKSLLNFCNYFITKEDKEKNFIQLEAVLPKEIKDYDFDYVYHVTNKYTYEKIKKYGLLPKDKTIFVDHPIRIYLWKGNIEDNNLRMFGRLNLRIYRDNQPDKSKFKNIDLNKDLVYLKIDLKKFEKKFNNKLKLYGDPLTSNNIAMFTVEAIPTDCIEKINI